jgi:ATP-binding cassette subfamily A (ABC1) protein 3
MSLIGCPKVEFLDEPTTGVDPVSRRSLFKMLKNLQDSSLILTTHRMDEAESLCDKIVIMINGRFVCYGSPGHLKTTYGHGYSLNIKHEVPVDLIIQELPYLNLVNSQ